MIKRKFILNGFILGFLLVATFAFSKAKPVDVLMIGHYAPRQGEESWEKYQKACASQGVRVFINEQGRELDYDQFTDEYLRQFHVVLFGGLPGTAEGQEDKRTKAAAEFRKRLDAYYNAGGGVLWVPEAFSQWATPWNRLVGDRYDVQCLEEDIYDPEKTIDVHAALKKQNMFQYIWTTNVTKHPVTNKVKGLFLPFRGEWSWPGTVPMKFGKSWKVLVKGMASTRTMGNAEPPESGKKNFKPEVKGSYESEPEFVGVREGKDGSGRMMVFPFHGTHTYLNLGHEAFRDAMMFNGFGGHPSNAHQLLINGYKWLAEPAKKAGLGGYQPQPKVTAAIPEPLDWTKAKFPPNSWGGVRTFWNQKKQQDTPMTDLITPNGKNFKGILGARTVASGGQGSVADYVKVAKELGLSFVVFLEKLEKLDEKKYRKLVDDCSAATDENFAAIPGYLFRDQAGLLYYFYGVGSLPCADQFDKDGRINSPYNLVDQYRWKGNLGLAELGKMKLNPNYLFLLCNTSPYVYQGAKLIDDGLKNYLSIEGHGHQYTPTVLVEVESPDAMKTAFKDGAKLTILHAETLDKGLNNLTRRSPKHPVPVYISNGPAMVRWGALNPIGQPFFAGKQRLQISLKATSDVGIAEVKIINANTGKIFRRFKPNGAKSFSCTIDETHQRQWSLVPIVTDINGRSALAGTLQTFQDGNRLWMMGDRLMGMHHAHTWDPTRTRLVMEGGWVGSIPWTKNWRNEANGNPQKLKQPRAGGGEVPITGKVVGIDGGNASSQGHVNFYWKHSIVSDQGTEPKIQAYRFNSTLASFDTAIMDFDGSEQFAKKKTKKGNWPPNPDQQIPMETADIQVRVKAVRPSPEATVSSNMHEVVYTFKKDLTLKQLPLFRTAWQYQHSNLMNLLVNEGNGDLSWMLDNTSRFSRKGKLPQGGYYYPCNKFGGQIGVINLGSEPLTYQFGYPTASVFVNGENRHVKAGDKMVLRYIIFRGLKGKDSGNNQWLQKFISDFGIGKTKPGYPFKVTQGKLLSTNYQMDLQAENGGATVEFDKYQMHHSLLVRVNGFATNAIVGRYDLDRKQLLILPVLEENVTTSVNTSRWKNRLYIGELFHCNNSNVLLSCVQNGADKLLLEIHNPTDKPQPVKLSTVPGFQPLAGLEKSMKVAPFTSTKLELPTPAGTLVNKPYMGD